VKSAITDKNGVATFTNTFYGPYSVIVNDSKYRSNASQVTHSGALSKTSIALVTADAPLHDMAISS